MFLCCFFALINAAENMMNHHKDGYEDAICSKEAYEKNYGEIKSAKANCRYMKNQKFPYKNQKMFCDLTCENASEYNYFWLRRYRRIKVVL